MLCCCCRYRQQLEADRLELERIHAERLGRLAAREEEVSEKLRRQQRDVEGIAYSQRQRILAEEDRLRNMKAEVGVVVRLTEVFMHIT
jgi:oral-facial-digital syndrome 1 protein